MLLMARMTESNPRYMPVVCIQIGPYLGSLFRYGRRHALADSSDRQTRSPAGMMVIPLQGLRRNPKGMPLPVDYQKDCKDMTANPSRWPRVAIGEQR